ncbi:hypothetical protein BK809_0005144 [Diplodia seriata]|uniref:magnesium chelatase n=1 Tax=Diplodia seriata TaxID=420778 RepID=A0A1S8B8Q3_9PEZI|nr:hypothetical protein BK809_0005144 [Diplodia seriata]
MSPSSHSAERVAEKVQTLSDLELAALLCLITKEHAIVEAEPSLLDPLCLELELIAGSVFGLSSTVLECSERTTLDTFGNGLLVEDDDISYFSSPPRNSRDTVCKRLSLTLASEVFAYMQNLIAFLRLHRAVSGGISALATRHFELLVRALAPLHGLNYVPPSLVALAARKIYPHRILLTAPENERSMQWGSSLEAVREVLDGVTVDDVIEDVLQQVEVPL